MPDLGPNEEPPSRSTNIIAGGTHGDIVQAGVIHEFHYHGDLAHPPIPRGLPRSPRRLVNRTQELLVLDRVLEEAESAAGPVVAVLGGMHGVGKSAMGSYWANLNRSRFHGGDLFGDFSKRRRGAVVDVSDVLGDFLRDLGTSDVAIPSTFPERQRLFRRLTAERKLLILLEDVDQSAQALDVLPSGAGSVVIVTSNFRLDELLANDAEFVELEPLDRDSSHQLLSQMVGSDRIAAEPGATGTLTDICAGLPIVLCVCASQLIKHPARTVASLVEQVSLVRQPLHALSGTGSYAVETIFDVAYEDLAANVALPYRRLGLHPGPDLTLPVAATLAGVSVRTAADALEMLHDTYLVEVPVSSRFRLHKLVRDHAVACTERYDTRSTRERAIGRLVDWYYAALRNADRAIVRDRLRLTDLERVPARNVPLFGSAPEASRWIESERANVIAVLGAAFDREWDTRVWHIAEALWPFCYNHKLYSEWIASHEAGVVSAQRVADISAEARMRSQLARAYADRGEAQRARTEMQEAKTAADVCGNDMLKASVREFDGSCDLRAGDITAALSAFRKSRRMFQDCGSIRGAAIQDYHIGQVLIMLGDHSHALRSLDDAQQALIPIGDEITVGRVLIRRGEALGALGRPSEARSALEESLRIMTRLEIWYEQAQAFEALATIAEQNRQFDLARTHRQCAYRIYKKYGHPKANELLAMISATS